MRVNGGEVLFDDIGKFRDFDGFVVKESFAFGHYIMERQLTDQSGMALVFTDIVLIVLISPLYY